MKELSASQIAQLFSDQDQTSYPVKTLMVNGVPLEFHQQNPVVAAELTLVVSEILKRSSDLESIIGRYLPQLQGKINNLPGTAILEIIGLIIQETYPGVSVTRERSV